MSWYRYKQLSNVIKDEIGLAEVVYIQAESARVAKYLKVALEAYYALEYEKDFKDIKWDESPLLIEDVSKALKDDKDFTRSLLYRDGRRYFWKKGLTIDLEGVETYGGN